jgi:hypothetical protein
MYDPIPFYRYKFLLGQIEIDYMNLLNSMEKLKENESDENLRSEICRDYSFLVQDLKCLRKLDQRFHPIERPVCGRILDIAGAVDIL